MDSIQFTSPILDDLTGEERYFDREISWLAFNERVLSLAEQADMPLGERLRFLAISAENLNEFFMVRVAGLLQLAKRGFKLVPSDDMPLDHLLEQIISRSRTLVHRQHQIVAKIPSLHPVPIRWFPLNKLYLIGNPPNDGTFAFPGSVPLT